MDQPVRLRSGVRRGSLAAIGGIVAAVLIGWSAVLPAAAETVEFTIADPRITESSGLATDRDHNRYWTVNDSGDSGIAYALDEQGTTEGTLRFRTEPVDVEAVAFHQGRLYVADIGDNRERRKMVTVYFFDDPAPDEQAVVYKAYDFVYPDGPHDAETLLVDAKGRLFIVTKGVGAGIYAAPTKPSRLAINRLERVGDAPGFVTDGTFLPDGRIALRTYVAVEILDPRTYQVLARAATPLQQQGESLTTTLDGQALLIGSEGKRSDVLRIDVPTTTEDVPTPAAGESAPATPAASTAPSPQDTGANDDDLPPEAQPSATASRQGTLAALGIAAAVAVVAGVVVALVRRT